MAPLIDLFEEFHFLRCPVIIPSYALGSASILQLNGY